MAVSFMIIFGPKSALVCSRRVIARCHVVLLLLIGLNAQTHILILRKVSVDQIVELGPYCFVCSVRARRLFQDIRKICVDLADHMLGIVSSFLRSSALFFILAKRLEIELAHEAPTIYFQKSVYWLRILLSGRLIFIDRRIKFRNVLVGTPLLVYEVLNLLRVRFEVRSFRLRACALRLLPNERSSHYSDGLLMKGIRGLSQGVNLKVALRRASLIGQAGNSLHSTLMRGASRC